MTLEKKCSLTTQSHAAAAALGDSFHCEKGKNLFIKSFVMTVLIVIKGQNLFKKSDTINYMALETKN